MKYGKEIVRATAVVTAIALLVKGLGFVEKIALAALFGTGMEVDAYLVAYSIPFGAFVVLREVVEASFVPTFLRTWRDSEEEGLRLFGVAATVLVLLLGAATAAGMAAAEGLVSLTAPGFGSAQSALTVRLIRLAMPALLFLGMSTLTTAALHAHKRFNPPAVGEASFRAGSLALLLATGSIVGTTIGVVIGALGKLVVEVLGLGRRLWSVRPSLDLGSAPVRTVGRLAAPLLASLTLSLLVGPLVENAFASKAGVGAVAALAYARKIAETLTTILPYTLALVLLPFSAEMAADQDQGALATTLTRALRALTLLFLPISAGLMMLRTLFVQLLFERGAFTAASTQLTSDPLLFYGLALLPFALEVVVVRFFFARQDTLTPVIADVLAFAVNVSLIPPLMVSLGLGGIALAAAIAKALKVLALLLLFERKVAAFRLAALGRFAAQVAGATLATVAVLSALSLSGLPALASSFVGRAALLIAAAGAGGATFALAAYALQVEEVRSLWHRIRRP